MNKSSRRHWMSSDVKESFTWEPLAPGDIVDLVAPGSACKKSELLGAVKFVKSLGLIPRYSKDIFTGKTPILSSSDSRRFGFLRQAIESRDSKAIWCLRGGYGSLRLIPLLNKMIPPERAKLLMGYSDITTLHNFFNFFWRWPTLHGPVLDRFANQAHANYELKALKKIIFGQSHQVEFRNLKPMNPAALKKRSIRSSVVGGNLAVLISSLGTPWQMNPDAKILFLEDVGEKPHRLDRMFQQMLQSGYLARCRAIVLGDFVHPDAKIEKLGWKLAIEPFAGGLKIPVYRGMPCGHGKLQMPLPLFTRATLHTGPRAQLILQTGF